MGKQTKPFVHYRTYITSDNWYNKHPAWLKAVGYRCTMFPWIRIGKGHRYAIHHMNYKNLGYERLGRDVVPLSPFAHNFVIHGVLAGFKSAGKQGNYPNLLQRTVHFWCNQRLWFKVLLLFSILFAIAPPKSFIKRFRQKTFATLRKLLLPPFNIKSQFNLQVPKPRFKLNCCAASNLTHFDLGFCESILVCFGLKGQG